MADRPLSTVLRHIHRLAGTPVLEQFSDGQLLARFADDHEEAAFAALVRRHGPMVLGVCRRVLRDGHAADDAFQAAFLVLFRRGRFLRGQGSVANWLYTVAYHTALRARTDAARRKRQERQVQEMPRQRPHPEEAWRELQPVLDEELNRLPEKYRGPLVLCYLQGKTNEEAARLLGCPVGTVKGRMARARDLLRKRLGQRGMTLSAGLLGAVLAEHASAAVPGVLVDATVKTMRLLALGKTAAGLASAPAALAEGVLTTMCTAKLKIATALLLAVGMVGAGVLTHQALAQRHTQATAQTDRLPTVQAKEPSQPGPEPVRAANKPAAVAPAHPKPEGKPMTVTGRVFDPDGKPVAGAPVAVLGEVTRLERWWGWKLVRDVVGRGKADGHGRFRLTVPRTSSRRSWEVDVLAAHSGYGFGWKSFNPDANQADVVVRLLPEQVIGGRLVDLQGQPAAGVRLHVGRVAQKVRKVRENAEPGLLSSFTEGPVSDSKAIAIWDDEPAAGLPLWPKPVTSDAKGRFTIPGIGRNLEVTLAVRDEHFAPVTLHIDTAGKARAQNANHALQPGCILEGRVTYADTGKPVANADLASLGGRGKTNAQGRFRLNAYLPEPYTFDGGKPHVFAYAPEGQPYLGLRKDFQRPKGAVKLEINLALPRGLLVHGKVVEEGTGRPVPGSEVFYGPQGFDNERTGCSAVAAGPDGAFQIVAMPGPGHLLINGPTQDYVYRDVGGELVRYGKPGGQRLHYHGFAALDLKPAAKPPGLTVKLRRGVTIKGRLVGPDGKPVVEAEMLCRVIARYGTFRAVVRNGRFELHGCDPKETYPVLFLDARHRLGAGVKLSAKHPAGDPVTVRLTPCGSARLRFVDGQGQPRANFRPEVSLVLTPGPSIDQAREKGVLAADTIDLASSARRDSPRTDDQGRMTFPALIPGATYRVGWYDWHKEFTVDSGRTLKIPDVTIKESE